MKVDGQTSAASLGPLAQGSHQLRRSIDARVERDIARLLYQNGLTGTVVSIIVSAALCFALSDSAPLHLKLLWWGFMSILLLLRLVDVVYFLTRITDTEFSGKHFQNRFALGTCLSAVTWAAYPIMTFKYLSLIEYASALIVLSGMTGGAANILAAHRKVAWFYTICLLVPISWLSVNSDSRELIFLGGLSFVFCIVMLSAIKKTSEFTLRSVNALNKNTDLLDEMAQEKKAVNDLNHALEQKVKVRTQALQELATKDALTGLLNRKAFAPQLNRYIENVRGSKKQIAVFFLDLDGFKEVNDLRGHLAGDRVLNVIAKRIQALEGFAPARCRWGGDEFIVAREVDSDFQALNASRDIYASLSRSIEEGFDTLQIGVTIGIALFPQHGDNVEALVKAADLAMYSKKHTEKGGGALFNVQIQKDLHYNQQLSYDLHKAISSDQLFVQYQPIICADKSMRPLCFEALLRWKINEGIVSPEVFVPIAESSGAILDIGAWVLRRACKDAAQWKFDSEARVSVNVSIRQLMHRGFLTSVHAALELSGLNPSRLHIEITESLFAQDKRMVASKLESLRDIGIKVSIDDFGVGFSSLSYLQALPVDQIKIDKTFISSIESAGGPIIEATLSIAKALNYSVVAEGIETAEENSRVIALGAGYLQGFYHARPMNNAELDRWHRDFDWSSQTLN
ncbi:MAG: diguanylate cyclase (GGDEF)-like protein [Flavobacteriales bacterium]|jgi:diguanylate cyclase (GGDEF)-like protein